MFFLFLLKSMRCTGKMAQFAKWLLQNRLPFRCLLGTLSEWIGYKVACSCSSTLLWYITKSKNMFWEVWRNVTLATSNWGLGSGSSSKKDRSNSKSSKKSRYDRLISSPSPGGPKKSMSQPVNLTQFTTDLGEEDDVCDSSKQVFTTTLQSPPSSHFPPNDISNNKQTSSSNSRGVSSKSGGVKRSLSSFLPFSSCSLYGSAVKPPTPVASAEQNVHLQQTNNNNSNGDLKKVVASSESTTTAVISTAALDSNYNRDQSQMKPTRECSNQCGVGKEEIIDYWDENMELPTCEVCARAFPTIRQLAAHQQRKRHYGCIECDSIFPSREVLECHREQMCHYEFAVDMYNIDEGDLNDEDDFFESEDEENVRMWDEEEDDCDDEEMERLL